MIPSRFARLMMLLLAAIQFAAPAVTSVADGIFANQVVDARAHIEDQPTSDCEPPHSADCTVCRFLVDNSGAVTAPAVAGAIVVEQAQPDARMTLRAAIDGQPFDARGPPAFAS
jgi:hypothetical protein